jgi:hypothetical protein
MVSQLQSERKCAVKGCQISIIIRNRKVKISLHSAMADNISSGENPQKDATDQEIKAKIELIKLKVKNALEHVKYNRHHNRKKASFIKLTTTFCAAAATVLLGVESTGWEDIFKDIAIGLTATVTLLSALEPFFNFRALWVEHEVALWKFYRLDDKLEFYIAGNNSDTVDINTVNSFYVEYQSIWDELSQSWINYRKQENS